MTFPGPRIAPFRLDRLAGAGARALDGSRSSRWLLDEHAAATQVLQEATGPLLDQLFAAVPRAGRDGRRTLLACKRRVHSGGVLTAEECDRLVAAGVPDLELKTWLAARYELAEVRDRLCRALKLAEQDMSATLPAHLASGALALTLPLVAPEFAVRLADQSLVPGSRSARTALLYLVRAALKPSPSGHLTTVGLHPGGLLARSSVTLPVGFVHSLFAELAATPRYTDAFDYAPAPQAPSPDGSPRVVLLATSATEGFLWQTERIVDARLYSDELAAAPCDRPDRSARHVRMGLLVPVPPWRPGAASPLAVLAEAVSRSAAPDAPAVTAGLLSLDCAVAAVATADGRARRQLMTRVRDRADQAATLCSAPRWSGPLLHEDVSSSVAAGALPATVDSDLVSVAHHLRPHLFRSHVYDLVLAAFLGAYGRGGRCPDAAGFFFGLQVDPSFLRAVRQAKTSDLQLDAAGSGRAHLPVGPTSAPPAAAVMYQISATSAQAVRDGTYTMVVNQYGSALGGLLTRFGRVVGEEAVRAPLLAWLRQLFPGCDVRTLTLSAAVNNLQHAGAGYLPDIAWPSDPQQHGTRRGFAGLSLVHDPSSDTLAFEDCDGTPVAPVYTGIVPAGLCNGAARLALAVMDPWVDGSPLTRGNHPYLRGRDTGDGVLVTSRRSGGRVTLERARWVLPGGAFPLPAPGEDAWDHLIRLDGWRRSLGLPAEVFFLALGSDPLDANRRKPMWLDFASTHSVQLAVPLIAGCRALRVEEALPTSAQAWLPGADDDPRMCEYVSSLAWPRPAGVSG